MQEEEAIIRLKSITIRLQKGDNNSKYFHNYIKHRINANSIWKIEDESIDIVLGFHDIAKVGVKHFSGLYKEDQWAHVASMLDYLIRCLIPRFVVH